MLPASILKAIGISERPLQGPATHLPVLITKSAPWLAHWIMLPLLSRNWSATHSSGMPIWGQLF